VKRTEASENNGERARARARATLSSSEPGRIGDHVETAFSSPALLHLGGLRCRAPPRNRGIIFEGGYKANSRAHAP